MVGFFLKSLPVHQVSCTYMYIIPLKSLFWVNCFTDFSECIALFLMYTYIHECAYAHQFQSGAGTGYLWSDSVLRNRRNHCPYTERDSAGTYPWGSHHCLPYSIPQCHTHSSGICTPSHTLCTDSQAGSTCLPCTVHLLPADMMWHCSTDLHTPGEIRELRAILANIYMYLDHTHAEGRGPVHMERAARQGGKIKVSKKTDTLFMHVQKHPMGYMYFKLHTLSALGDEAECKINVHTCTMYMQVHVHLPLSLPALRYPAKLVMHTMYTRPLSTS